MLVTADESDIYASASLAIFPAGKTIGFTMAPHCHLDQASDNNKGDP